MHPDHGLDCLDVVGDSHCAVKVSRMAPRQLGDIQCDLTAGRGFAFMQDK